MSLTDSYTEDEPDIVIDILTKSVEMRTNFRAKPQFAKSLLVLKLPTKFQILSHTNLIPRTLNINTIHIKISFDCTLL